MTKGTFRCVPIDWPQFWMPLALSVLGAMAFLAVMFGAIEAQFPSAQGAYRAVAVERVDLTMRAVVLHVVSHSQIHSGGARIVAQDIAP